MKAAPGTLYATAVWLMVPGVSDSTADTGGAVVQYTIFEHPRCFEESIVAHRHEFIGGWNRVMCAPIRSPSRKQTQHRHILSTKRGKQVRLPDLQRTSSVTVDSHTPLRLRCTMYSLDAAYCSAKVVALYTLLCVTQAALYPCYETVRDKTSLVCLVGKKRASRALCLRGTVTDNEVGRCRKTLLRSPRVVALPTCWLLSCLLLCRVANQRSPDR